MLEMSMCMSDFSLRMHASEEIHTSHLTVDVTYISHFCASRAKQHADYFSCKTPRCLTLTSLKAESVDICTPINTVSELVWKQ